MNMSITEQKTEIPTGTYNADRVHSSVAFAVEYMGVGEFGGTVTDFEATLDNGRLSGSARIASLETKDENLYGHLMSPEFFDAERHPVVSFSTENASVDGSNVEFKGEITIKGVTQPATLTGTIVGPTADPYGNERYGLKLETTIDRTAFGINWNNDMPNGTKALSDQVTLKADLSLVKAA
jgi:polyisoprenoid-binding protein YceI